MTINYSATENSGSLATVLFQFTSPTGRIETIRADGTNLPLTGTVSAVVPDSWPNGTHTLDYITLLDAAGNQVTYHRPGDVSLYPSGASGPDSNPHTLNTADFTVAQPPNSPTDVAATSAEEAAEVRWTAAVPNGSPVTEYTVTALPGGRSATVAGDVTRATVSGLASGTAYTFTVTATNAIGTSASSASSNSVVPVSRPAVPRVRRTTADSGRAAVAFTPGFDGGSPVTGYATACVSTDGGATRSATGATSPITVTGLTPEKSYRCRVRATNAIGTSPYSPYGPTVVVAP